MNNFLNLLRLFPTVLGATTALETNFPGAPGANKKQIILDLVDAAAKMGEAVPNPMVQLIAYLVDVVVSSLNKNGVFAHAAPAVVPVAPPAV